jgi:hypothetical protein
MRLGDLSGVTQINLVLKTVSYLLTPKFGKVRSLTCGSNSVRNPSGTRKVSSNEFGKRVRGRQFASVRQGNCCADFVGFCGMTWPERKR